MRKATITGRLALAATAPLALALAACSTTSSSGNLPIGTLSQGISDGLLSPDSPPPGANVSGCTPSKAHPYPVILVHGTFENMSLNWQAVSPTLANAGYCVYAFNYGQTLASLGTFDGLDYIENSAQQLSNEVNQVLSATGASQVDIVGHSQGGLMPIYYVKDLGGASKVHTLVGLAPSNHGTTLDGLVTFANNLDLLGFATIIANAATMPSLGEQEAGSAFQNNLFAGGDTVPGPKFVVIETTHDEVVTPYTNAFLSGSNAQNITIQNQCPNDPVGHAGIPYDNVALQDMLNVLGSDSSSFAPTCSGYGDAL